MCHNCFGTDNQLAVQTPGGSISTKKTQQCQALSQAQFGTSTEQEPVYHKINDMFKDSSNHDKAENSSNNGYAVLMDDSSITNIQVDELNIEEKIQ